MKMRRDTVTGIAGLLGCAFFLSATQSIKQPAKLLEPGPRLLPYVAIVLIAMSSIALIIKGIKERAKEEKPYFPKGGALKITKSYLLLIVYAFAMTWLGFLMTAGLYAMFVFGFQVKLPAGRLFE